MLHGIGFDTELFTPTFAVARAGGWTAHVLEQAAEDRLIRPSVAYVGEQESATATARPTLRLPLRSPQR